MIERENATVSAGLIAFVVYYLGLCLVPLGMALPLASVWGYRWLACIPIIIGTMGLLMTSKSVRSKSNFFFLLTPVEVTCLLFWTFLSILSVIFSEHFAAALVRQVEWFVIIGFSLVLGIFLIKNPRVITHVFLAISLGFLLVVAGFVSKWLVLDKPHYYDWWERPLFYFHMRHLGYHAVAAFAAAFFWFFSSVRRFDKFWWLAFFQIVISVSVIAWSGSRSGLVVIFFASVFLLFTYLRGDFSKKRDLLIFVFISILCGWLASEWFWTISEGMGLSVAHGKPLDNLSSNEFSSGRLDMWKQVLAYLYSHSMILGFGPDGYVYMDGKPTLPVHPHSFYIQAVGEWGIGAIPFFAMFALIFLRAGIYIFNHKSDSRYASWLAAWVFCLCYLVQGLVDGPFYHSWSLAMFSLTFAVLLTANQKNYERTDSGFSGSLFHSLFKSRLTWVVGLFVMSLHASVNIAQMGRIPDTPDSPKATLVKAFPSHNIVLGAWYDHWISKNPAITLDGLHWLQRHSFTNSAWKYYVEEGNYYRDKGDFNKARNLYDMAIKKAPVNLKEADSNALDSLREGLPSSVD